MEYALDVILNSPLLAEANASKECYTRAERQQSGGKSFDWRIEYRSMSYVFHLLGQNSHMSLSF